MEVIKHHPVFFTATIIRWQKLLQPEKYKLVIAKHLEELVLSRKIYLFALCIMDNHIHLIWQVLGEYSPSEIQKRFLEGTAKEIIADLKLNHPNVLAHFGSTQKDRRLHVWKRRPLSIELFSDHIFDQKLEYIHNNPVKAGLVTHPDEYSFSSAAFYAGKTSRFSFLTHAYS